MKNRRDVVFFGAMGILLGSIPALLAAGFYVAVQRGTRLTDVGMLSVFEYLPWSAGYPAGDVRAGLVAGLIVLLLSVAATLILGLRPRLSSHGAAVWGTRSGAEDHGQTARLGAIRYPVYGKFGGPRSRRAYSDKTPHGLVVAPTGAGKGIGIVIPTLLTYPGSVICLDPKGENYIKTARHRESCGDTVYRLAPYHPEEKSHRFNPVDDVRGAPEAHRYSRARRLAVGFISPGGKGADTFTGGARDLLAAVIVHAIEQETPTLAAVYDYVYAPGLPADTLENLALTTRDRAARAVLYKMAMTESRAQSAYLSVLSDGGLGIWAEEQVRRATEVSDFSAGEMRQRPVSLYIDIPPDDLDTLAPLVRLLVQQTISILQRAEPGQDEPFPVLFLLDEFAGLGRLDVLQMGITTLRSFGCRVMIIVQSLANLRANGYGSDGANIFLANCGVQVFMATSDLETPDYLSRAIGDYTRKAQSRSWRTGEPGKTGITERAEGARLLRPEAARVMPEDDIIVLIKGHHPLQVKRIRYFEDRGLAPLFTAQSDLDYPAVPALHRNADASPETGTEPEPEPQTASANTPDTVVSRTMVSGPPAVQIPAPEPEFPTPGPEAAEHTEIRGRIAQNQRFRELIRKARESSAARSDGMLSQDEVVIAEPPARSGLMNTS